MKRYTERPRALALIGILVFCCTTLPNMVMTANAFGISSATTNAIGTGVELSIDADSDKDYKIISRDNSFTSTTNLLDQRTATGNYVFTNEGVVGSVSSRFYQLIEIDSGTHTTNPVVYAAYVKSTIPNQWYRISVPVDTDTGNTLNSTLGDMLASGAVGDSLIGDRLYAKDADGTWRIYMLDQNNVWQPISTGESSSDAITSCQGMWLKRMSSTGSRNMILVGPVFNDTATPSHTFLQNKWQLIAWPYPTSRKASENWGFEDDGAQKGANFRSGDNIIVDGEILWLDSNGNWRRPNGTSASQKTLKPMDAYYYLHRGSSFTWTPEE